MSIWNTDRHRLGPRCSPGSGSAEDQIQGGGGGGGGGGGRHNYSNERTAGLWSRRENDVSILATKY